MQANSKNILISAAAALLMLLSACSGGTVYNEYRSIKDNAWPYDSAMVFDYVARDTAKHYDVIVDVRHNDNYRYQNFWMFIKSVSPEGISRTDTVECFLADNKGRWLSKRGLSSYSMPVLYMQNIKFPVKGNYRFEVFHGLRDSVLQAVGGIGLSIKENSDGKE